MDLYHGRFKEEVADLAQAFNHSLPIDYKLYPYDIMGSIAHAQMLGACGIIETAEAEELVAGLKAIKADIEAGKLSFNSSAEDIHLFIEEELTQRLGDVGKKLHTARSRNDQVALDLKLYVKDKLEGLIALLKNLETAIFKLAEEHLETLMPGYTHLQIAQPVTFAHHIMAYAQMFLRDLENLKACQDHLETCPLGAGALATTTYPIDRFQTAQALGFKHPAWNSLDAVSDRDFIIESLSCLATFSLHLSRLAEELIIFSSQEYQFVEISEQYSTGSSIMPQKKNPDMAELIRGKAGKMLANLQGFLTTLKGLPLAYNKDMQEDKTYLFDSVETAEMLAKIMTGMLETLTVKGERMAEMAHLGYINATDAADYLVKKGLPFRQAYYMIGEIVQDAIAQKLPLCDIPLTVYQQYSPLFEEDYYEAIDLDHILSGRQVFGGPAPSCVAQQIELTREAVQNI